MEISLLVFKMTSSPSIVNIKLLAPDTILILPLISSLFVGIDTPIPILPLFLTINTSPELLDRDNISSLTPFWSIETAVSVPELFISNFSVVNTFVSKVVLSPNIVKLEVIRSPFISISPVYVAKLIDITPLLSIVVFGPNLIPPKFS